MGVLTMLSYGVSWPVNVLCSLTLISLGSGNGVKGDKNIVNMLQVGNFGVS